jgi:hypothetical protein
VDGIFAVRAASIERADQDITNSDRKVSAGEATPTAGSLRGETAMSEVTEASSLGRLRPRSQRQAPNQEAKTASRNSDIATGCVIYKTDQFLVDFGYEGTDACAKNGNFIVEAVCPEPEGDPGLLERVRPEKWGRPHKIEVSHRLVSRCSARILRSSKIVRR